MRINYGLRIPPLLLCLLMAFGFSQGCVHTAGTPKQMQKTNVCLTMKGFAFGSGLVKAENGKPNGNGMQVVESGWHGSGFIAKEDGTVVTNYHVAQHALGGIALFDDDKRTSVEVVGIKAYDTRNDIAIIKLKGSKYNPVVMGDSDGPQLTDKVTAVGNPQGIGLNITEGTVSQIRKDPRSGNVARLVHTARIAPGNSGGALYHNRKVVGVNNASIVPHQINFAIPINRVKPLLEKKKAYTFDAVFPLNVDKLAKKIKNQFSRRDAVPAAFSNNPGVWNTSAQFEQLEDYYIMLQTDNNSDLELVVLSMATGEPIGIGTQSGNTEQVLISSQHHQEVKICVVNGGRKPAIFALSVNKIEW